MNALTLSLESVSIVIGGTHTITHALKRAFSAMGGEFCVETEVDKVLVENGRAKGVRLSNGTEVEAKQVVVSDLGVPQTIFRLLGENFVTPKVARRIRNIRYDRSQIYWGNMAMHELPKYKAVSFNPDIGTQPRLYMGENDPEYISWKYQADIFTKGFPEKWYMLAAPDSISDKTRAPEGKHCGVWGILLWRGSRLLWGGSNLLVVGVHRLAVYCCVLIGLAAVNCIACGCCRTNKGGGTGHPSH